MADETIVKLRGEGGVEFGFALPLTETMLNQVEAGTLQPADEESAAALAEVHDDSIIGDDPGVVEVHVSPAAEKLAEELGVDLADVTGTGKGDSITKGDVEDAAPAADDDPNDGGSDDPDPQEDDGTGDDPADPVDYSGLNMAELKVELDRRGIEYTAKPGTSKASLGALLVADDEKNDGGSADD